MSGLRKRRLGVREVAGPPAMKTGGGLGRALMAAMPWMGVAAMTALWARERGRGAGEEREILHPQHDVEHAVHAAQDRGDRHRSRPTPQNRRTVERNHQRRRSGRAEISRAGGHHLTQR